MLVQVEHEVVGDDRVAGGEEGDQSADEVALGRHHLAQVDEVVGEVDLLDGPRVADRRPVALVELRVAHRSQRQVETWIEDRSSLIRMEWAGGDLPGDIDVDELFGERHQLQTSHASGFSREQATAASSVTAPSASVLIGDTPATGVSSCDGLVPPVVVWAMRVAGRDRR